MKNLKLNQRGKLKNKFFLVLMVMFGITTFMSCEKKENTSEPQFENKYSKLALLLENSLYDIGQNLRKQKSTFSSQNDVVLAAKQHFSDEPKAYHAFLETYAKSVSGTYKKSTAYNEVIDAVIDEIEVGLINSSSAVNFTNLLEEKFDEITISEMHIENKDFLLQYITLYKTSVEFISSNLDIIANQNGVLKSTQGWWSDWGRCAAGILGGTGLGALGGGAAGSVIPVLGTTAGLIIGGIAGGLSGAAASC